MAHVCGHCDLHRFRCRCRLVCRAVMTSDSLRQVWAVPGRALLGNGGVFPPVCVGNGSSRCALWLYVFVVSLSELYEGLGVYYALGVL